MNRNIERDNYVAEMESALFIQTGLYPCENMTNFVYNQPLQWVYDLANLIRYESTKNRTIRRDYESELTKQGYKESKQTYTYILV